MAAAVEFAELIIDILIFLLDSGVITSDVISWLRGRENRRQRREARRYQLPVPPRDGWNRAVIPLTLLGAALTAVLVWRLI